MAEKSNAELLQILTAKFKKASEGGALSDERVSYAKWLKNNTGVKLLKDGTRETVWKSGPNKGKKFNPKEGSKLFNKEYWGTETPRKDLKYLQESERSRLRIKTQRGDRLRTRFSKDDFEGKNIYQQEVTARETKEQERLAKLKVGTSFARKETAKTDEALVSSGDRAIAQKLKEVDNVTTRLKLAKDLFNPANHPILDAAASFRNEDLSKYSNILGTELFKGHSSLDGRAFQVTEKGGSDFKSDLESEALGTGARINKDGDVEISTKTDKQKWLEKTANSPAAKAGLSDEMRWEAQKSHQLWKVEQGRMNKDDLKIGE